jgi:hypothetical protein
MILWKSLHSRSTATPTIRPAPAGDGDQHELLPGSWMISRGVPRWMRRPPMIVYPDSGWTVLRAQPVAQGLQVSAALPRRGKR